MCMRKSLFIRYGLFLGFFFFLGGTISLVYSQSVVKAEEISIESKEDIKVLNEKISQHKDKIKELEETISKYKDHIKHTQLEAVSFKNQLNILDNRVAQVEADIELTKEKIAETQLEIDSLKISIKDKQIIIERQKNFITKMVKDIHAEDQKNSLEILLTNQSFADFYNQLRYLENVYIDLGRSVKALNSARQELETKKKEIEDRQALYDTFKTELEQKKQDLDEQVDLKRSLLAETRSSELRFQTLLDGLKRQYQVVEGEVRTYEEQVRKKLVEQDRFKPNGDISLSWPLSSHYITAGFHDPSYPFRNVFEHNAIDIRAAHGTPIKAAASGYVGRARRCSSASCYSYVLLVHTGNISTVYGHLSSILVTEDQFVNRGDIIGYSGGTPGTVGAGPFVTGAHLHFEVRVNGIPADPLGYLP